MKKIIGLVIIMAVFFAPKAVCAAGVEFVGYSYQHNFTYGETFNISVTVKNNSGALIANAYFSPVLTNSSTGAEKYPTGSAAADFAAGETRTYTTQGWGTLPAAGKYSVTLVMYDGADADIGRGFRDYPNPIPTPPPH